MEYFLWFAKCKWTGHCECNSYLIIVLNVYGFSVLRAKTFPFYLDKREKCYVILWPLQMFPRLAIKFALNQSAGLATSWPKLTIEVLEYWGPIDTGNRQVGLREGLGPFWTEEWERERRGGRERCCHWLFFCCSSDYSGSYPDTWLLSFYW